LVLLTGVRIFFYFTLRNGDDVDPTDTTWIGYMVHHTTDNNRRTNGNRTIINPSNSSSSFMLNSNDVTKLIQRLRSQSHRISNPNQLLHLSSSSTFSASPSLSTSGKITSHLQICIITFFSFCFPISISISYFIHTLCKSLFRISIFAYFWFILRFSMLQFYIF
jgi:hypothetical protein